MDRPPLEELHCQRSCWSSPTGCPPSPWPTASWSSTPAACAVGTHAELLGTDPLYAELAATQFLVPAD